uniref:Putative mobilization protein n=1 Tax=Pedobacter sp. BG5 TaxID=524386 RepID=B9VWJ8_9SPHI|nr:relaxase/mobilization nuclease domain-containing protein [Pedobacter sp. BG5]ACM47722.1 putative mobilization protein [Pedobacter sp. BG5]
MPTANANTGNGFSKAISYALQEAKKYSKEERAKVLELNQVYGSSKEMGKQMREVSDDRKTVQKPVLHVQINFHPDEKLNNAQARQAIDSILKDIGIEKDNHQYVIVQHKDKEHDHYHIVANRVGMDGELLNDHRIKERLQVACDKAEQEQRLRRTQGRTVLYDPTQEKGFRYVTNEEKEDYKASKPRSQKKRIADKNPAIYNEKFAIQLEINIILRDRSVTSPEHFKERLKAENVDVKFTTQASGISGVSFRRNEISIKGSAIDAKWGRIDQGLTTNAILSKETELMAYVREKSVKNANSVHVVDQAIRGKMLEIKPNQNPWATWHTNPDHDQLYNKLHEYSEKLLEANKDRGTTLNSANEEPEQEEERRPRRKR